MPKRLILLFLTAALAAFVAIPALGQGTAPTPCNGVAATDPKGDQGGSRGGAAAGDNLDITEYFFRTVGTATTAHIKVTNMSKALPADPTVDGVSWFAYWDDAEGVNTFVSLTID